MEMKTFMDAEGDFSTYLRFEPVHDLDFILNSIQNQEILYTNSPAGTQTALESLCLVEKQRQRKYKDPNKKSRYGALFEGLIPLGIDKEQKRKLAEDFINSCIGLEKLICFVWEEKRGMASYLMFYFTDREWLPYRNTHYKRNVYQDAAGNFCSKEDPEAHLVKKKGDFKESLKPGFSLTKTRIFTYTDNNFEQFMQKWNDFWRHALIHARSVAEGKFKLIRKKIHPEMARYLKRVYIHQNQLMVYIENVLNQLYRVIYPDAYDLSRYGGNASEELWTAHNGRLVGIFKHYSNRFKNNLFHVEGCSFRLNGRADLADANIDYLKKIFIDEIKSTFAEEHQDLRLLL